jgi:GT2 family glycosyltransferase
MSEPRTAVVVLNWNGWPDTLECLASLRPAVEGRLARVIVVDNASTDPSVLRIGEWLRAAGGSVAVVADGEALPAQPSDYTLIRSGRNGGFAAGNNLGIALALAMGVEYVFLLNNDATVEAESIPALVACADQDPAAAIIGSTLIEEGGQIKIAGGARYNRLLTISKRALAAQGNRRGQMNYVAGAAMFIRAEALRKVGLLDEDYFLYFEELDLTERVTAAGFRIGWCAESIVYHQRGRSAGSRSGVHSRKSSLSEYHSNLSCLIFTHKFYPRLFWLAAPIRFLLKLAHHLLSFRPALVVPLVRAYHDGLGRAKGTAA